MLMLIITNTERRNAVTGVRPLQFNNARQALEAVKGQLKMHVATIHAETLNVDDTIPLVIGFVGRGNAAESVLANVLAANGDDTPAFLERCGVIGAYQLPETNDTEILNGYVDEVHRNLATYLPTPEGALGSGEPLIIEGLELLVGSPLNAVVSSDGAQLGRPVAATQVADVEEVADVNVTEQQPEVETPVVAEAQPVTQTQIQTEETVMSATNMTKAELMRAARQLHSDLAASVPNFLPIESAFGDASRLRRYCTLSLSDLPQPVLAELQERAEEVVACLQELAALTATQGDEIDPIPAQEVAGDDEDFAPVPDQQLDAEDDEEFEEVETEVETDDEVGTVDAEVDTNEVDTDADTLDLNDAGVLAEKLPAIFLLTQGRLDEIEGVMAPVAEFAMAFKAEQGEDFNGFDESDVAEAVESGEMVNVMTLLDDCDWLDAASFDLLYELDGSLTDVCADAGFDVQGEVDQSGVDLDAGRRRRRDAGRHWRS